MGDSGVLVSLIRVDEADGSRVEELVTATPDVVTVREPAPMRVSDDGGPNWAFPLGMPAGSHHYLFYEQGPRGGLVAGRLTTNDDVTDMVRIPRFIDDETNFNPNFITPVFAPHGASPKPVFLVAGTERPKNGAMRATIRMYDDRAGGASVFRGDAEGIPQDLVAIADLERVAYAFTLGNKIYVGAVAPRTVAQHIVGIDDSSPSATTSLEPTLEPLVVGASSGGAALAFEGRDVHLVWPDAGHLRHGIVSMGDGGAGATDTSLDVPSDGSMPALVIESGKTRLAWRDGTRIWYGEGPTLETASRHASAFSEIRRIERPLDGEHVERHAHHVDRGRDQRSAPRDRDVQVTSGARCHEVDEASAPLRSRDGDRGTSSLVRRLPRRRRVGDDDEQRPVMPSIDAIEPHADHFVREFVGEDHHGAAALRGSRELAELWTRRRHRPGFAKPRHVLVEHLCIGTDDRDSQPVERGCHVRHDAQDTSVSHPGRWEERSRTSCRLLPSVDAAPRRCEPRRFA